MRRAYEQGTHRQSRCVPCSYGLAWRGVRVAYGVGMGVAYGVGRARAVLPVIRPAGHAAKRQ